MSKKNPFLQDVDRWGTERAITVDPIFIRALPQSSDIVRAGIAEYEAIYRKQSHCFCSLSELVQFIYDTIGAGSEGGGTDGQAAKK